MNEESATPRPALIVAWAEDRVIGQGGKLPWHLPNDLGRFKRLTMSHHLIVGRRTWESIGSALPGRRMVVVSRQELEIPDGVQTANSPEAALELALDALDPEPMIAGGAAIYRALLPRAQRIYLTRVHAELEGDVHFPPIDLSAWKLRQREDHPADERHAHPYSFLVYERASQ